MDTLLPNDTSPSKITFTSIKQSLPAETSPLTSTLDGSDIVIPIFNRSFAFISLYIPSNSDNSSFVLAPFTSSLGTIHVLILNPFVFIIETISVK